MSVDRENPMQLEAIKAEKEPMSKFKMYVGYLKEKGKDADGDLIQVDIDNLDEIDLEVYEETLTFLRSISEQNCSAEFISAGYKKISINSRDCSSIYVGAFITNKIVPLFFIAKADWDQKQECVSDALERLDPENLF